MSADPTTPIPGPLAPLQAADALPPCPVCHGYGTADGDPAGHLARDTYDDPGPCRACGGSGDYTWKAAGDLPVRHDHARAFDWVPSLDFIEMPAVIGRCITLPLFVEDKP